MNRDDALDLMRRVLHEIAPEADLADVRPDETMQEGLDLDSIDFLNFVTGLAQATGLEMPERDYQSLSTVEGCVGYLVRATTPGA
jgi:acyl carrier protein